MAIYSQKCVSCTDPTKQCLGEYQGKDESGNYRGAMYRCSNTHCEISLALRKTSKDLPTVSETKRHCHDSDRNKSFYRGTHIENYNGNRRFPRKYHDK